MKRKSSNTDNSVGNPSKQIKTTDTKANNKPKLTKSSNENLHSSNLKTAGKSKLDGKGETITTHSKELVRKDTGKQNFNKQKRGQFKNKFNKPGNKDATKDGKPNWTEYKKERRNIHLKRKQGRTNFEVAVKARKIGERLRRKTLDGGLGERTKLVKELYDVLGGPVNYQKYVLQHDMSRMVQYLLKYGTQSIKNEVAKELAPISAAIIISKYGKYCIKRLLKSSNPDTRSSIIQALYGNAIKLTSHAVSAPIFEYAYSTWASPLQKQHLIQEFFGDIYKQTKDNDVKHLRDVYKASPDMKTAALSATKANISRLINKQFLDSSLLQSVLCQYFEECSVEDRNEFISQLAPHIVIISNSKDGAQVALNCIWHGTTKGRKICMKAVKEHVIDLCKHEHGHVVVIGLLDIVDDTVLLNKMIITPILMDVQALVSNEWGRKVILWLVAPNDKTYFHPAFIKDLETGRVNATCKKESSVRRKEIGDFCIPTLLNHISGNPGFWLSKASIAVVAYAIMKNGSGDPLTYAGKAVVQVLLDPQWKIKEGDNEILGIEHPGLHMTFKKILQNAEESGKVLRQAFADVLVDEITNDTIKLWIKLNRGCFMLVLVYENAEQATQAKLKEKLQPNIKLLEKQDTPGAAILLKKIKKSGV